MRLFPGLLFLIFWFLFTILGANAQVSGEIDPTFKTSKSFGPDIRSEDNLIIKKLPDQGILVGGAFQYFSGFRSPGLVKLLPDGQVDTSFQVLLNRVHLAGFQILPDQKILAWGLFSLQEGGLNTNLVRLLANGQLDPDFNIIPQNVFCSIASRLSDNSLVVSVSNSSGYTLKGLTANGNPNPNFQFQGQVEKVIPLPDEGFLVLNAHQMKRYYNDGVLNPDFVCNEFVWYETEVLPGPGGKLVCLSGNGFFRLHADGGLDSTFMYASTSFSKNQLLQVDANGDIYVRIIKEYENNQILKFKNSGEWDSTYNNRMPSGVAYEIVPDTEGWLALGQFQLAHFDYEGFEVKRFFHTGVEREKRKTSGFNGRIEKMMVLPDQKVLVSGTFTQFDSISTVFLARLHPNGNLDTSFHSPFQEKNLKWLDNYKGWIRSISCSADGKILVTGMFDTVGTTPKSQVALLLPSGALDPNFTLDLSYLWEPNARFDVKQAYIMGNQKIYAKVDKIKGGWESSGIIKANLDGSRNLDFQHQASFEPGFTFSSLQKASDQFLYIESSTDGFNDDGIVNPTFIPPHIDFIKKLRLNGQVDSSFLFQNITGLMLGAIHQIQEDYQGNLLVSFFRSNQWFYNGVGFIKCNQLGAIINSSFWLLNTFDPFDENLGIPAPIVVAPDTSIIFLETEWKLGKVCSSGWADGNFSSGDFGGGFVNAIVQADSNSFYVAGSFNNISGQPINRIVRLKNYPCVTTSVSSPIRQDDLVVFPNPGKDYLTIRMGAEMGKDVHIKMVDMQGREVLYSLVPSEASGIEITVPTQSLPSGLYHIQVVCGNKNQSVRWVKN